MMTETQPASSGAWPMLPAAQVTRGPAAVGYAADSDLVHCAQPLTSEIVQRLAAYRQLRTDLPCGISISKSLQDLSSLPSGLSIPRTMRLEVSAARPITGDDLRSRQEFAVLSRLGELWLKVPFAPRHDSPAGWGGCRFRGGPRRWLATLAVDSALLEASETRRGVFEGLASSEAWPIRIESAGDESFVIRGEQSYSSSAVCGAGKQALDPDRFTLAGSGAWETGLDALRSALELFDASTPWQWGFEISTAEAPVGAVSPEELWVALRRLDLPVDEASLTLAGTFGSVAALDQLRDSFGAKDRAVTDLVTLEIAPGYEAEVDLVTLESGHFFEAQLRGGWGDVERRQLEELLEAPIAEGASKSAEHSV